MKRARSRRLTEAWPAAEKGTLRHHDARLQALWHDHAVRGARGCHWQGDWSVHVATPASGMAQISAPHRSRDTEAPRRAPDRRQLRHPQARQGSGLAQTASALSHALHPNLRLLDQSGRTLFRLDYRGTHSPRCVQERRRTGSGYRAIPGDHNADPRPFVWTASAITILEKVSRGRQTLESVH